MPILSLDNLLSYILQCFAPTFSLLGYKLVLVFDFSLFQTTKCKVILTPNVGSILCYSIPTACASHLNSNYLARPNEESKRKN